MKRKLTLLATAMAALCASADLPVKLLNNSGGQFADSEIYVAIIGKDKVGDVEREIYYDLAATANEKRCVTRPLNAGLNTIHKDGQEWGFAYVFTRMSDLRDHTVYLGNTHACRMFISFKSPMFLHVHDAGGYAGHDFNNPNDPNNGLRWELIEFTYEQTFQNNTGQIWINTTRVDAFQYPMGLELYSRGDVAGSTAYIKRGETVDYQAVISRWNSTLGGTPYANCLDANITYDNLGGIIKQPSKVESVKHQNLFGSYIDKIWDYFRNNTANISMGVLGRWEGRVSGDTFTLTCKEGHYWPIGAQAHIYAKPSTEDAIEGAGQFANAIAGGDQAAIDLTVQAMFCAAFNRGMFRTTTALQDWNPEGPTKAFTGGTEFPCNEYVKFFHDTAITASQGRTYAFAYDDTFDQSATCYSTAPTSATVTIGGFVNGGGTGGTETPPVTADVPAAPRPDKDAALVKSLFSGAYNSITPGITFGWWNQATQPTVEQCGGDDAYRLVNFDYQGLQLDGDNGTVDVSDMEYVHLDFYALSEMTVNFYPISLDPTVDSDKIAIKLPANAWGGIDIPLSTFPNVDFHKLGQLKFDGGAGQTLYIDNIYFWKNGSQTVTDAPADVPDPTHDAANVASIFSHKYNTAIATNVGSWGQSTQAEVTQINGKNVYRLGNFNYLGLEFEGNNGRLDASGYTHMHVDYWTPDGTAFGFTPISPGEPAKEKLWTAPAVEKNSWNRYDVPLTYFDNVNFNELFQTKFDLGTGNTGYLANVYFYKDGGTVTPPATQGGCTYSFTQAEGTHLRGAYTVEFTTSGNTVNVRAKFYGDYADSPGAYFWNLSYTGDFETQMTRDGEWYTASIPNQTIGSQLKYQIMLPITGGQAKTKEGAYYVVGGECTGSTGGTTLLGGMEYSGSLAITPNPASDVTVISVDEPGSITVYDINGRRMTAMPVDGQATLNVAAWTRGMYVVRYTSVNGQTATARLLH